MLDACGVCNGDGRSCLDCLGTRNGHAETDACGVCDGNGSSCVDCTGTPHGVAVTDACGVCDGDGRSCAPARGKPGLTPVTETIAAGKEGYVTYRLKFDLPEDEENCYTIFGDSDHHMIIPAAFQVDAPFGTNTGGTNPAFWPIMPDSQWDSWLTAGLTEGDTAGATSSIGVNWDGWTEEAGLSVDDGAIFWMAPDDAPRLPEVVVAQLTLPDAVAEWAAVMNAQGRSSEGVSVVCSSIHI